MSITAVLANFNHGHLIKEAIACLNAQKILPLEIIVIDDASTDNSLEVIAQLTKTYTNITLIKNAKNLGAINSYNTGLINVKTEYVYFAAADDLTHPELFSKGIRALRISQSAAFVCMKALILEIEKGDISQRPFINPRIKNVYMNQRNVQKEFKSNDNWILTGTTIFKTNDIRGEGGFDASLGAAADAYIARVLAFKKGCVFIPYFGVTWRISQFGESKRLMLENSQEVGSKIEEKILANAQIPDWYASKFKKRWNFAITRNYLANSQLNLTNLTHIPVDPRISRLLINLRLHNEIIKFLLLIWAFVNNRPFGYWRTARRLVNLRFRITAKESTSFSE